MMPLPSRRAAPRSRQRARPRERLTKRLASCKCGDAHGEAGEAARPAEGLRLRTANRKGAERSIGTRPRPAPSIPPPPAPTRRIERAARNRGESPVVVRPEIDAAAAKRGIGRAVRLAPRSAGTRARRGTAAPRRPKCDSVPARSTQAPDAPARGSDHGDSDGIDRYPGVSGPRLTLGSGAAARPLPSGPDLI
jgi:hypothetical protein